MALTKEEAARQTRQNELRQQDELRERLRKQHEETARKAQEEARRREEAERERIKMLPAALEKMIDDVLSTRYKEGALMSIHVPRHYGACPPDNVIEDVLRRYRAAGWDITFDMQKDLPKRPSDLEYYFYLT